jgi:hypothetical protein
LSLLKTSKENSQVSLAILRTYQPRTYLVFVVCDLRWFVMNQNWRWTEARMDLSISSIFVKGCRQLSSLMAYLFLR